MVEIDTSQAYTKIMKIPEPMARPQYPKYT